MKSQNQSKGAEKPTLAQLLAVIAAPETKLLVIQRLGPGADEAVAVGSVKEVKAARCVEVCGDRPVEKIAVEVEGYPWDTGPVLIITIGPRGAK